MPTSEALVRTTNPNRYLTQLCKHASAMGQARHFGARIHLGAQLDRGEVQVSAEWSDTRGTVSFRPWGTCALTTTGDTLALRAEGIDEDGLLSIQDVITRDIERFGRREHLTVEWQREQNPETASDSGTAR